MCLFFPLCILSASHTLWTDLPAAPTPPHVPARCVLLVAPFASPATALHFFATTLLSFCMVRVLPAGPCRPVPAYWWEHRVCLGFVQPPWAPAMLLLLYYVISWILYFFFSPLVSQISQCTVIIFDLWIVWITVVELERVSSVLLPHLTRCRKLPLFLIPEHCFATL